MKTIIDEINKKEYKVTFRSGKNRTYLYKSIPYCEIIVLDNRYFKGVFKTDGTFEAEFFAEYTLDNEPIRTLSIDEMIKEIGDSEFTTYSDE